MKGCKMVELEDIKRLNEAAKQFNLSLKRLSEALTEAAREFVKFMKEQKKWTN